MLGCSYHICTIAIIFEGVQAYKLDLSEFEGLDLLLRDLFIDNLEHIVFLLNRVYIVDLLLLIVYHVNCQDLSISYRIYQLEICIVGVDLSQLVSFVAQE